MQDLSPIFYVIILLVSVVIHEIAHGYAALRFGDTTAKYAGRLTLNPLKHLDMFGSILLPALLLITNAPFLIGWAKPVPYNPDNFRPEDRQRGMLWVAAAGILANLSIAVFFGLIIRASVYFNFASESFVTLASAIVLINIVLAVFNLIPIPPLDGSKILFSVLGYKSARLEAWFERYSLFVLLFFIFFLWKFIIPVVFGLFRLITGSA